MKFSIVCHLVVVVGLLELLDFSVSATPIQKGNEKHPGPKTKEERKEAYEAFYKGEQTIKHPSDHSSRNVIPETKYRWPDARVPYVIDASIPDSNKSIINDAMEDYHSKTCIKFVPRLDEVNYILILADQGCYSYVGMIGGAQPISLVRGCMWIGTIVHELGHAVGFYHEQNRSDRDQYLKIYVNNIQDGMASQFDKLKPYQNLLLEPFDYNSVMLYGNKAFSKDGILNTMVARNGQTLVEPYDKPGLSNSDVIRLKEIYC